MSFYVYRTIIYQLSNRNYWVVFQACFEYIEIKSPDSVRPQRHGLFSSVLGVPWQTCYRCIKPGEQTKELCQKSARNGGIGRQRWAQGQAYLAVDKEVACLFDQNLVLFFFQGSSSFKAEKPRNKGVCSYNEENGF